MIVPAILILMGIIATIWFKISPKNHKILLAEIERRKKGGPATAVTPEAKAVCESLTGYKYEQLWKDVTISKEIRDKTVV